MKPHVIFVAIALVSLLLAPAPLPAASNDVLSVAGRFVDLLAREDFAGAVAQFDPATKTAIPEPKLKQAWQSIQDRSGRYQKQIHAEASKDSAYDVVLVTCQFERTKMDVKVVLNSGRLVSGLFFVSSRADALSPPPYADTNAYREQDFTVGHGAWALPGTLTLPTTGPGPWPAVVLVHGSGPEDRDETVGANTPFRDLAVGLATKGIAVLRYEKRTKEHPTLLALEGIRNFTVQEETIDDAVAAAAQLRAFKGIDPARIFVIGHSLGGTLAPRIAKADTNLAGLIILAGATRPLEDLMVEQTRYLISLNGQPTAEEKATLAKIESEAAKVKLLTAADAGSATMLLQAPAQYWLDLRHYDVVGTAKSLKQPMLILQGQRDYQVTQADFDGWKTSLAASPTVTFKLYPDLNHLFMPGQGRSTPSEYDQAGHVAAEVITDIADWIQHPPGK